MKYEPNFFKNTYDILIRNTNLGRLYKEHILGLCKDIYLPIGKWNKLYGERYGVINTGYSLKNIKMIAGEREQDFYLSYYNMMDTIWSLLNKIDTHYTTTATIVDYISNKYNIDFIFSTSTDNVSMKQNRISWSLLEEYMTKESKNILTPYGDDPEIFYEIMGYLAWTYFLGEEAEYESMRNFGNILGFKNITKSELGQNKDIYKGKDFEADKNSVQVKKFTSIVKDREFIRFPNTPNKEGYQNVDMFSFWNYDEWFVFKNENVSTNGTFTFKVESLIYPPLDEYKKQF